MPEGFGLSNSSKGIAPDVFDESENLQGDLAIDGNPVTGIFEKIPIKDQESLIRH